jgi:hypothetical protein
VKDDQAYHTNEEKMVWWWLELHLFDGLDLDLEGGRDPPYTCLPAGFSSWLDP